MQKIISLALLALSLAACSNQPHKSDKPQSYYYAKPGQPMAEYAPTSPLLGQAAHAIKIESPDYTYDATLVEPPKLINP